MKRRYKRRNRFSASTFPFLAPATGFLVLLCILFFTVTVVQQRTNFRNFAATVAGDPGIGTGTGTGSSNNNNTSPVTYQCNANGACVRSGTNGGTGVGYNDGNCSGQCVASAPAPANGGTSSSGTVDACSNSSCGPGSYCGGACGVSGNPNTLITCQGTCQGRGTGCTVATTQACSNGCQRNVVGGDQCIDSNNKPVGNVNAWPSSCENNGGKCYATATTCPAAAPGGKLAFACLDASTGVAVPNQMCCSVQGGPGGGGAAIGTVISKVSSGDIVPGTKTVCGSKTGACFPSTPCDSSKETTCENNETYCTNGQPVIQVLTCTNNQWGNVVSKIGNSTCYSCTTSSATIPSSVINSINVSLPDWIKSALAPFGAQFQGVLHARHSAGSKVYDTALTFAYDAGSKLFKSNGFTLSTLPADTYAMILHIDGYLNTQLHSSDGGTTFSLPSTDTTLGMKVPDMIAGDVAPAGGDNMIDILDANAMVSCIQQKDKCSNNTLFDLNGDGVVDTKDYDILISNFGQQGSFLDKPTIECTNNPACKAKNNTMQFCSLLCNFKQGSL